MSILNLHYKIGLRALKTALAVFLCLIADRLRGGRDAFYSAIAAIICIQPTPEQSKMTGINRFIGTLIGGLCGYLVLRLSEHIPQYDYTALVIIPLGLLVNIYICNVINKQEAVPICCVVYLSVVTHFARTITSTEWYVLNRIIETTIGILIAVLVNKEIRAYREPAAPAPPDKNKN